MSKDTPVAFVSWATRYNQRVVTATLEDAYEVAIREEVKPPTLIVVGTVVNLRDTLNFFEKKPLFGKSIMVKKPKQQISRENNGLRWKSYRNTNNKNWKSSR